MACEPIPEFEDCKDPSSSLPYSFTWTNWMAAEGTTLVANVLNASIVITLQDEDETDITPLVAGDITIDVANSVVFVQLTGGTEGLKYYITCHIIAANGYEEDQTGLLTCVHK